MPKNDIPKNDIPKNDIPKNVQGADAFSACATESKSALSKEVAQENLSGCKSPCDDEYELVELDFTEDDIVYYLEDEHANRIGFVLMEDGKEVEYFYVEDTQNESKGKNLKADPEKHTTSKTSKNDFDLNITADDIARATRDMNKIYKDGKVVAAELKDTFDDIKKALDFTSVLH